MAPIPAPAPIGGCLPAALDAPTTLEGGICDGSEGDEVDENAVDVDGNECGGGDVEEVRGAGAEAEVEAE